MKFSVRHYPSWDESYSYVLIHSLGLLGHLKSANVILDQARYFSESLEAFSLLALKTTMKVHPQIIIKALVYCKKSYLFFYFIIIFLLSKG